MTRRTRLAVEALDHRRLPSFSPAVYYPTGEEPQSLMSADFNNDGRLDLVTANAAYGADSVSVLLGNGDGTFQPPRSTPTGAYPLALTVGDFNEDGQLDVATANDVVPGNEGISVLLGRGDGTFVRTDSPIGFEWSSAIVAGDLNADGHVDLVATEVFLDEGTGVSVMLGHGDGTFTWTLYGIYSGTLSPPVLANANSDDYVDVAVPGVVFLGNGDGTLQEPILDYTDPDLWTAMADFNNDGILDRTGYGSEGLSISLGNGDGTFAPPIWTTAGYSPSSLAVGDFNGDGRPDAAVANFPNTVAVLLNDGIWNGPPAVPSLRIGDATVTEGNTGSINATFTVTLSAASSQPITVHYATADGSAAAGSDYTAASGDVTFSPGQTSKTISVAVRGDRLGEPTEIFAVNLSAATSASIAAGQGIGTILDNEPRISISDVSKKEGNGKKSTSFTFTVTLSSAYDQAVTMSFRTVNGTATTGDSDYVAQTSTLTFKPGETSKTITIVVNGDNKREADEYFYLELFGNSSNSLFAKNRGIGTILNDD